LKYNIIDNFLDNPQKIREFSIENLYYPPTINENWLGFRTKVFSEKDTGLVGDIINKIWVSLEKNLKIDRKNFKISSYLHYSPKICEISATDKGGIFSEAGGIFSKYRFHVDSTYTNYAGLIYLTPNPPENSGTFFVRGKDLDYIENQYNRMIFYDSSIIHAPASFFGESLDDSRLTFVFFIKKNNFNNVTPKSNNIFNLK